MTELLSAIWVTGRCLYTVSKYTSIFGTSAEKVSPYEHVLSFEANPKSVSACRKVSPICLYKQKLNISFLSVRNSYTLCGVRNLVSMCFGVSLKHK